MKYKKRINKGFTLLEILLVIAAIGILAAIVLVAINPNKQIEAARQAKRRSDINTITKAIQQYSIDNNGQYPTGIETGAKPICNTDNTPVGCVNLSTALTPTYIASIPEADSNRYYVRKNTSGTSIEVSHPKDNIWDIGGTPSLDLNFAKNKSLIDSVSGNNLVTFTRAAITSTADTDGSEASDLPTSGLGATYFDSTGVLRYAAPGAPRFDHNPVTGESLGLLVEEQRTNLLVRSEEFASSPWVLNNNATITSNADAAPNGTLTADQFNGAALSATGVFVIPTVASGLSHTFSIYVKNVSNATTLRLGIESNPANAFVTFNATTGQITSAAANVTASSVINVGNGWYRVVVNYTSTGTSAGVVIYSMSGSAATWLAWGAQLEAGAFPTSYIPTTTATVTRSADVASITGTNFSSWYNQSEGMFFGEGRTASTSPGPLMVARGVNGGDRHQMGISSGATITANVVQADFSFAIASQTKVAYGYATNNIALVTDKNALTTDTSATMPANLTYATIGRFDFGGAESFNGTIRRLTYWPTRLSNTTLQNITK